jgi:hypothetical protein
MFVLLLCNSGEVFSVHAKIQDVWLVFLILLLSILVCSCNLAEAQMNCICLRADHLVLFCAATMRTTR